MAHSITCKIETVRHPIWSEDKPTLFYHTLNFGKLKEHD